MGDGEKVEAVLQVLRNAAEFGDILDPKDVWDAIGEAPERWLSEDAMLSFEGLRP